MASSLGGIRHGDPTDKAEGIHPHRTLVVIAIIALLIGILLPALGEARKTARVTVCMANDQQLGVATQSYAADYHDRLFSFTWKRTLAPDALKSSPGLPTTAGTDLVAATIQAIDILHRRGDRTDMSVPASWIPHVLYTHLVLQDYLAARLPEPMVVCPEDRVRLNWQKQPRDLHDTGFWLPLQEQPAEINKRWPYSSSYQIVPASYDNTKEPVDRIAQAGSHRFYVVPPGSTLGNKKLGDVTFPGNKVQMHDSHQRHFGNKGTRYYAYEDARVPLLFFDASVRVEITDDSNWGWNPRAPTGGAMSFSYLPSLWELGGGPMPTPGVGSTVKGHYRWTRDGLNGIDFGAWEVNTGQSTIYGPGGP